MKQEWHIILEIDKRDRIRGHLKAVSPALRFPTVDLNRITEAILADLAPLDMLRNRHSVKSSRKFPDLLPTAERIGRELSRMLSPYPAVKELARIRPGETRLVVFSEGARVHALPWELLILPDDETPLALQEDFEFVRRTMPVDPVKKPLSIPAPPPG